MASVVRDIDRGAGRVGVLARVHAAVRVGVQGQEASAGKTGPDGGAGLTVAEVASFHEFGLGVPRRSFIADYADETMDRQRERLRVIARRVGRGAPLETELDRLGLRIVGEIQARISKNIPPKLADSTRDRKNSSVALINTGQLRSSITHRVVQGGGDG